MCIKVNHHSSPSLEYNHYLSTQRVPPAVPTGCSYLRMIHSIRDNPKGDRGVVEGERGDTPDNSHHCHTHCAVMKRESNRLVTHTGYQGFEWETCKLSSSITHSVLFPSTRCSLHFPQDFFSPVFSPHSPAEDRNRGHLPKTSPCQSSSFR